MDRPPPSESRTNYKTQNHCHHSRRPKLSGWLPLTYVHFVDFSPRPRVCLSTADQNQDRKPEDKTAKRAFISSLSMRNYCGKAAAIWWRHIRSRSSRSAVHIRISTFGETLNTAWSDDDRFGTVALRHGSETTAWGHLPRPQSSQDSRKMFNVNVKMSKNGWDGGKRPHWLKRVQSYRKKLNWYKINLNEMT